MEETAVCSALPKMMIVLGTLLAIRMEQYSAWKDFRIPKMNVERVRT